MLWHSACISFLGLPSQQQQQKHRLDSLNNVHLLSWSWRLEGWDQGAVGVGFSGGVSSWLADGYLLGLSSQHFLFGCCFCCLSIPGVSLCHYISSYKDISHIPLGSILMSSFNLITSLWVLSPNTVTIWGTGT